MARGRKAYTTPRTERELSLPSDVLARFDLLYMDPVRGKTRYGILSQIVSLLLNEYIDDVINGRRAPIGAINLPTQKGKNK